MAEATEVTVHEGAPEVAPAEALINVVRSAIFPKGTDAELAVYFHVCQVAGVSPLDKAIVPVVFQNKDGTRTLSFITTIDLFRSKAEETGEYRGSDEPEFEGEYEQECYNYDTKQTESIIVPVLCRVKVYRAGWDKPAIGVARWKEYYPGESKGHKWRQMPTTMLAKCAEALAMRKGFPRQLQKLYTAEEMELTTSIMANVPKIEMQPPIVTNPAASQQSNPQESPSDEERAAKGWISAAQEKRLYAILKTAGVSKDAICNSIAAKHKTAQGHLWEVTKGKSGGKSEYDALCEAIEKTPDAFKKYETVQIAKPAPTSPVAAQPVQTPPPPPVQEAAPAAATPDNGFMDAVNGLLHGVVGRDQAERTAMLGNLVSPYNKAIEDLNEVEQKSVINQLTQMFAASKKA